MTRSLRRTGSPVRKKLSAIFLTRQRCAMPFPAPALCTTLPGLPILRLPPSVPLKQFGRTHWVTRSFSRHPDRQESAGSFSRAHCTCTASRGPFTVPASRLANSSSRITKRHSACLTRFCVTARYTGLVAMKQIGSTSS